MAVFVRKSDPLVSCPYNQVHRMLKSRLQMHLVKCKKDNILVEKKVCPFNAQHVIDPERYQSHISICPDRAIIDRQITAKEKIENEFRGTIAVPTYRSLDNAHNEIWELSAEPKAGYEPEKYLENKHHLIKDMAHHKPAEKKKIYMESFQSSKDSSKQDGSGTILPAPAAKTPKAPATQENIRRPKADAQILQDFQRGRSKEKAGPRSEGVGSKSRLAAKFSSQTAANNNISESIDVLSSNIAGVNIGRGRQIPQ